MELIGGLRGAGHELVGADDQTDLFVLETNVGTVYGETDAGKQVTLWDAERSPYWPVGMSCWLTHPMVAPIPEPDPKIDPDAPVPDDPGELLPDAPEPLPPAPIEPTPDDPGGDPGGVPEPA